MGLQVLGHLAATCRAKPKVRRRCSRALERPQVGPTGYGLNLAARLEVDGFRLACTWLVAGHLGLDHAHHRGETSRAVPELRRGDIDVQ